MTNPLEVSELSQQQQFEFERLKRNLRLRFEFDFLIKYINLEESRS